MSTGAWIFTGLICAAVIAPASVFAAAAAKTQLVGSVTSHVAGVTGQGQLQTTEISPAHVIRISGGSNQSGCTTLYTPPAGKAIVVMSVTYTYGSGSQGTEHFGGFGSGNCGTIYDQIDTVQAFDTVQHTFPSGLPLPNIGISNGSSKLINVFVEGYLIDANSLPSAANVRTSGTVKSMPARR
jgi:hypothetical protein